MGLHFTIFLLGLAATAQAATLNVSFSPDTLFASPGGTVQFSGSLTNTTDATVFLNGDSFTFDIPNAVDDFPFLSDAPISLGPNASSGIFSFLNITVPGDQATGTYNGVFTVSGGADPSTLDSVGSAPFHLVVNPVVGVPEPGSALLLGVGLAALFWRRPTSS